MEHTELLSYLLQLSQHGFYVLAALEYITYSNGIHIYLMHYLRFTCWSSLEVQAMMDGYLSEEWFFPSRVSFLNFHYSLIELLAANWNKFCTKCCCRCGDNVCWFGPFLFSLNKGNSAFTWLAVMPLCMKAEYGPIVLPSLNLEILILGIKILGGLYISSVSLSDSRIHGWGCFPY